MYLLFGWRRDITDEWTGLPVACPFCTCMTAHSGYCVRRWLILAYIPVPLPGDQYVICGRCGRRRSVTAAQFPQIRQAGYGRRALYHLQEVNPEAAQRIIKAIEAGKASEADLLSLVGQAWEPGVSEGEGAPLTVAEAEAQLRAEGGDFPADRK